MAKKGGRIGVQRVGAEDLGDLAWEVWGVWETGPASCEAP